MTNSSRNHFWNHIFHLGNIYILFSKTKGKWSCSPYLGVASPALHRNTPELRLCFGGRGGGGEGWGVVLVTRVRVGDLQEPVAAAERKKIFILAIITIGPNDHLHTEQK